MRFDDDGKPVRVRNTLVVGQSDYFTGGGNSNEAGFKILTEVGEVVTTQADSLLNPAGAILVKPDADVLSAMLLAIVQVLHRRFHSA